MSANEIVMVIGAISILLNTVLIPGIILILKELKSQNVTMDKIHLQTNTAAETSLQLVADTADKVAKKSKDPDDFILADAARSALSAAKLETQSIVNKMMEK